MRISELISRLEKFKEIHGDHPVLSQNDYTGSFSEPTGLIAMKPYGGYPRLMLHDKKVNAVRLGSVTVCPSGIKCYKGLESENYEKR